MLVKLAEIEPKKPLHRTFEAEALKVQTVTQEVKVEDVTASFRFQVDPLGFLVKFQLRGRAELTCIRSAEPFWQEINVEDWISLRVTEPNDHHVVLGNAEMNVRFIEDLNFDVARFVAELIELELPAYPRREGSDTEDEVSEAASDESSTASSPFSVLSKFLD